MGCHIIENTRFEARGGEVLGIICERCGSINSGGRQTCLICGEKLSHAGFRGEGKEPPEAREELGRSSRERPEEKVGERTEGFSAGVPPYSLPAWYPPPPVYYPYGYPVAYVVLPASPFQQGYYPAYYAYPESRNVSSTRSAYPYPPYQPSWQEKQPRRHRALYILGIIFLVLALAGGGVAAAFVYMREKPVIFQLGDGKAKRENVFLKNIVLRHEDGILVLEGSYENETPSSGDIFVTLKARIEGSSRLINFTIPVEAGESETFTQEKEVSSKPTSASLYSITFREEEKNVYEEGSLPSETPSPEEVPSSPSQFPGANLLLPPSPSSE